MPDATQAAKPADRRYAKMTMENQMRASQWMFKNANVLGSMTLEEITGAINGQARLDQTMAIRNTRRLMEAAGLAWRPSTANESRVKLQGMYDKMLALQGRIEELEEANHRLTQELSSLVRRVDAVVENSNWTSSPADEPTINRT